MLEIVKRQEAEHNEKIADKCRELFQLLIEERDNEKTNM